MAAFSSSISRPRKISLFLNTSFLFLLSFCLKIHFYPSTSSFLDQSNEHTKVFSYARGLRMSSGGCTGIHECTDYEAKCAYVKTQNGCLPNGYINYLHIFYCTCGRFPAWGYTVLLLWLAVLFYLLGNTAANYFCSSLENLSRVLKLSPTIAGVTLLSLGNGAADVFASIVSFTRTGDGDVGLNIVLGGAFFVSSVVVGIISIFIGPRQISVDKPSFIRDVIFFLIALASLLVIIIIGKVSFWGSVCFVSIYFFYVCAVSTTHILWKREESVVDLYDISPDSRSFFLRSHDELGENGTPLLGYVDEEKPNLAERRDPEGEKQSKRFWNPDSSTCYYWGWFLYVLEFPLYLPRRLTIPVVSEERWSKLYAVISVTLAPLLLAALWNTQRGSAGSKSSIITFMIAGLIGVIFGNLAFVATKKSSPPKRCLFPWLAGGFLMSVTWTYIIAEELVSLLVSFGNILGISPAVLGLTVLAWGNSLGDLIANVALAANGGQDGVQIAVSGCYAGAMFNTLVGLGLSMVFSAWHEYPAPYIIPIDPSLYETVGFLMSGLLWALVILPNKNMKPDRFLGIGLLAIYVCFLFLRVARTVGLLKL